MTRGQGVGEDQSWAYREIGKGRWTSLPLYLAVTLPECLTVSLPVCLQDELQVRRRQLGECERGQEALSRVTSCFQQLSSALGSSCDGSFLREEMEESRVLAYKICCGTTCLSVCLTYKICCGTTCLSVCLAYKICCGTTCLSV